MKVYLDNQATTPIDPRVKEEIIRCYDNFWGNPASAGHAWGWQAEEMVNIARGRVARLIKGDEKGIVFTSGATESINLALLGFRDSKPKRVLYSAIEHKAVLDVTKELVHCGFEAVQIRVDNSGRLDLEMLKNELVKPTLIVSIIAANNEIGTIQDLYEIKKLCRSKNALLHLDITQLLAQKEFDYSKIGADLLSFSSHKMYGPKGIGVLYLNQIARDEIRPIIFGGGHQSGLRAGTLNTTSISGLGIACKILSEELPEIQNHLLKLSNRALDNLRAQIPEITINGSTEHRLPGNLNMSLPGLNASDLLAKLASKVALSTTSACLSKSGGSSYVLEAIGLTPAQRVSSFRLSPGRFNTIEEIDFATNEIFSTYKTLKK